MGSGMIGAGTGAPGSSRNSSHKRQPSVQGDRGMLPPVMSCETAYKSSPTHWKRYAVREGLGMRPPALRDKPRKVVALRSDAMHSSSDVKTTSAALRLERTNLHPKPPIVWSGCRRQPRVVLCLCKRAVISRTTAIDINSLSHVFLVRLEGTDCMCVTVK